MVGGGLAVLCYVCSSNDDLDPCMDDYEVNAEHLIDCSTQGGSSAGENSLDNGCSKFKEVIEANGRYTTTSKC